MTETKEHAFDARVEDAITKAASALDKAKTPEARTVLLEQLSSLHEVAGRSFPLEKASCVPSPNLREILGAVISDIKVGRYQYPFQIVDSSDPDGYLALMVSHVFKHLAETGKGHLSKLFTSDRSLKKALANARLISINDISFVLDDGRRQTHAVALSVQGLREIGLTL